MKTLIICFSYHHKNTAKIALVFASKLNAEIKTPQEINPNNLSEYDIIGFGSGIYFGKHHKSLLELADKLLQVTDKKAFIFSTSGRTGNSVKFHKKLKEKLQSKGFTIIGEFNCAGLDTYGLMKITGGINKERPNKDDIKQAEAFAQSLNQASTVGKS
ncbi:MAG: flavodoxin family protein [Candidatus Bathyarchaeia archaeon]|jgi:flavodoxin